MQKKSMLMEMLESRVLLSTGPITLATISGAGSRVAVDAQGNVFGTTVGSAGIPGTVFEIPAGSGIVETVASFDSFVPARTNFYASPDDIVIDPAGNLYGDMTTGLWELPKVSKTFVLLDEQPNDHSESTISSLAVDSSGDLFWESTQRGSLTTDFLTEAFSFSPSRGEAVVVGDQDIGFLATVSGSLSCDAAGNDFVPVINGSQHYVTTPDGNFVFDGTSATGGSTATGTAADTHGNVYATTDGINGNPAVVKYNIASRQLTVLGYLDGKTQGTQLGDPVADSAGDVFAVSADGGNLGYGAIVELPAGQSTFKTVASFETPNESQQASALVIDSNGDLFDTLPGVAGTAVVEWPRAGTPTYPINPTPNAITGLQPAVAAIKLPRAIVGGVHFGGTVRVHLSVLPHGAPAGVVTTKLFALTNGSAVLLGQISQRYRAGVRSLTHTFRISTRLPAGSYTLIAQSSDASGNIVTGPFGSTITVQAPFAQVVAGVAAITPRVHPGSTGVIVLALTNTGNIAATAPITISIADNFTLVTRLLRVVVPAGRRAVRVRLKFAVPAGTAGGLYDPVVTVTEAGETSVTNSSRQFLVY